MRVCSVLLPRSPPSLALGIAVAASLVTAETLLLYPLRMFVPRSSLGVIYLLGILVVATVWGLWLGAATSVASVLAFNFFHLPPAGITLGLRDLVRSIVFLTVALLTSSLAELSRSRSAESRLSADMARILLYTDDLRSALPAVAQRLARTLNLRSATIELKTVPADERYTAFPLGEGATQLGTLLVPANLSMRARQRLQERVVPSLESLLHAAREREAMLSSVRESRLQLIASRARIVAAADDARRRIERDLHDGAQQQLVALALELRVVEAAMPPELEKFKARLSHATQELMGIFKNLQEISRGIHPAIVSEGGLAPALRTLARRSAIPVDLDVHVDRRLPELVEVAAYYVVSESLTNAAKHAYASLVHVEVEAEGGVLRLSVRDDGVGGADPDRGSGLIGLKDRVEALGGHIEIASPGGGGTLLLAKIPIEGG